MYSLGYAVRASWLSTKLFQVEMCVQWQYLLQSVGIIASAVCRQYALDFAADFLSTLQFGVATGGVEQLVKSLKIHLQQIPDWYVLKTDFFNAFNSSIVLSRVCHWTTLNFLPRTRSFCSILLPGPWPTFLWIRKFRSY